MAEALALAEALARMKSGDMLQSQVAEALIPVQVRGLGHQI